MSIKQKLTKEIQHFRQQTGRPPEKLFIIVREAAELMISFWGCMRIDSHSPKSIEEMQEILPEKLTPLNSGYVYEGVKIYLQEDFNKQ